MLGANFLLFYLMAKNLNTEETGEEDCEGQREAPHWLWGREKLSPLLLYLLSSCSFKETLLT